MIRNKKKLSLDAQTVVSLNQHQLQDARGGKPPNDSQCTRQMSGCIDRPPP